MALTDPLIGPDAPATRLRAVTPNDSTDLPDGPCRALQIGVAGDINVIAKDDEDEQAQVVTVQAGVWQCMVRRVLATSTTADNIVALY